MRRALLAALAAALAAAPAPPARRGLVVCDDVADPVTLDPHRAFENKSYSVLQQVYEGLLKVDADGGLAPALATSCDRADPLTLRCRIRPGVRFHDGEPLDAEAVRWSLERLLDPKTGFPAAMELASIAKVTAPSPDVVEIRTSRPDGLLPWRLASFVKIAPPRYFASVGPERFAEAPVGTGPFKFVRWTRGSSIELAPNEEYWEKGKPALGGLTFRFVPEERQLALLHAGELDLVTELPATRTLEVVKDARLRVLKRLVLTTPAFWFTSFSGPLADRRVRQALNLAVSKDALIRYAVLGNGKPLASLAMRGESGRDESLEPYPYDPARARALLKEAGASGLRVSILAADQASREAKILASSWARVGVRAEVAVKPLREVHLSMVRREREYDVTGNLAPNPTAHVYFLPGVCFHSGSLFSRLKDAEFDRRYESLVAAVEPAEQERLARELDRWIHEQALAVFTYQKIRTFAAREGLEMSIPVNGLLDFKEARWGS